MRKPSSATVRPASRLSRSFPTVLLPAALCLVAASVGPAQSAEIGRVFFTPTERAQLEAARARASNRLESPRAASAGDPPAPVRYDGIVIRSDGKTTRWVDGAAESNGAGPSGLKPGQIRSNGKVYEPYQVVRPLDPPPPHEKELPR